MDIEQTLARRPRLFAWAAIVIGLGFVASEALLLNVRIRDFDEGVYWQSIRALARHEPLFGSVFASQPPGFYYLLLPLYFLARSLASLRLTVLVVAAVGLIATYMVARMLGGRLAALIAVALVASSPLYFHESAIVQADGPSLAFSIAALWLAMVAVRRPDPEATLMAAISGAVLAASIGIKFVSVVALVPVGMVLLGRAAGRWRRLIAAAAGGTVGLFVVFLPAILQPSAAFTELILEHIRAGQAPPLPNTPSNLDLLFLRRDLPLEGLALLAFVVAALVRDRRVVVPAIWAALSIVAVLLYQPLFPHHLLMLSIPFALIVAVGTAHLPELVSGALVLATAAAASAAIYGDVHLSMVPDHHDTEMASAVAAVSHPDDFWISDNPYAVALADRSVPGPMVDTASQRIRTGLLTVNDLESARVHYRVRWVLEDSFRLDGAPGYRTWLNEHYHAVENLGGRAVIYEAN